MLRTNIPHPSNRLYNNEVRGFRDAVDTYICAMQYEMDLFTEDDDFNRESKELFAKDIETARSLKVQYEHAVGDAERALAERWKLSKDETVAAFGRAILDGDWSPLAV